jgi:hypothetical protein
LGILVSGKKRAMIRRAALAAWESKHPPGPEFQSVDMKFPLEDPHWNNNDPANRREMGDLRNMIIKGIKESVPDPKT